MPFSPSTVSARRATASGFMLSTGERRSEAGGTAIGSTSARPISTMWASRLEPRSSGSSRSGSYPVCCRLPSTPESFLPSAPADPKEFDPIVELRLRRRSELAQRETKPRQYFIIDEAVIRRHVGIKKDRTIMPNQLRSIAERAEQDDLVTVRVIPFQSGAHPGLFDSFTLLEFEVRRAARQSFISKQSGSSSP